MTDDFLDQLEFATKLKRVPCPNCNAKLERRIVMTETSKNAGRPYVACAKCSENGKISFWFLDHGECDLCGCPMYQGPAKKGGFIGRVFEACSQKCPGKFRWLD
jgi:hypothetical protein